MAFIQDPRIRQRWNQISHNAEAVTENAAAGIWNFQHQYITPCFGGLLDCFDGCTSLCFGDREERARRARERDRGAIRARPEYMFDFYDDWDDADDEDPSAGGGGLLGSWGGGRSEDWDRLLAGTGSGRGRYGATGQGDVVHQPKRKRGMSYGTRGGRRKASGEEDPTIIPSTAPLGFLGRLPFKIGGTLRYKPSAANLQDHPGAPAQEDQAEHEPLLGESDEEDFLHERAAQSRPRSNTAGSGDTSSSYRSRGDLFPSDGEGDEDAVPLDDEFAVALDRVDDRASNKTRSSKGKRPADRSMHRTVSRTTISSIQTRDSSRGLASSTSLPAMEDMLPPQSLEDLRREEEEAEREEHEEVERKRRRASQLAIQRGLSKDDLVAEVLSEPKPEMLQVDEIENPSTTTGVDVDGPDQLDESELVEEVSSPRQSSVEPRSTLRVEEEFVPARLPHFR